MNMPYAIPTHDRGSSIWEKALVAFLVNAAGGVAQQGVENAMARDFAPEFGEEKAGGLSKLISGPKVGKADASQRRQQAFVADQNEAARMAAAGQSEADAANALLRQDRTIAAGRESDEMRLDAQNAQSYLDARNADLQRSRSLDDRSALARLESQLYNERPDVKSQAARDAAAAEEAIARTNFQKQITEEMELARRAREGRPTTASSTKPRDSILKQAAVEKTKDSDHNGLAQAIADFLVGDPYADATYAPGVTIEPNTLRQISRDAIKSQPLTPSDGSNTRANEAIADTMRGFGYGVTNFFRPQNWRGDMETAVYEPENGSLPAQLQSRYDALSDKNSATAQHLISLGKLLGITIK